MFQNRDPVNGGYLPPTYIGQLLREERERLAESTQRLIEEGFDGEDLFADLYRIPLCRERWQS